MGAPAVPNRLAHGFERTLEGRVADALLRPNLLTQLRLGDNAVGMHEQIGEDLEHFAPQLPDLPGPAQLRALRIECTLAEDVHHKGQSPLCATRQTPQAALSAPTRTAGREAHDFVRVRHLPRPPERSPYGTAPSIPLDGVQ